MKWRGLFDEREMQTINSGTFLSARYQREVDCQSEWIRLLAGSPHSEDMAKGR